jgi:hypothetical protein
MKRRVHRADRRRAGRVASCGVGAAADPFIGFLHSGSERGTERLMVAFRAGLKEVGYAEGHNVRVEYRWADGAYEHLPSLMRSASPFRRQYSCAPTT